MTFIAEPIGRCGCGNLVTHRIMGHPGNVDYGKACEKCANRQADSLTAAKVVPKR